jgi:hypothetical protein
MTPYTYRLNALEKETTLTLDGDVMRVEREGRLEQFPLRDVTEVRLSYNPSRADRQRYDCRVTIRGGGRLTIRSTTYKGIGDFGNQGEAYGEFVRALHERLATIDGIGFKKGDSAFRYYGSLGCFGSSILMLFLVLLMTGLLFIPWIAVAKLLVLIFFLPWLYKYAKLNRPGTYDPRVIPDEILP